MFDTRRSPRHVLAADRLQNAGTSGHTEGVVERVERVEHTYMPAVLFHRITAPNRRLPISRRPLDMPFSRFPCAAVGVCYPSDKHLNFTAVMRREE